MSFRRDFWENLAQDAVYNRHRKYNHKITLFVMFMSFSELQSAPKGTPWASIRGNFRHLLYDLGLWSLEAASRVQFLEQNDLADVQKHLNWASVSTKVGQHLSGPLHLIDSRRFGNLFSHIHFTIWWFRRRAISQYIYIYIYIYIYMYVLRTLSITYIYTSLKYVYIYIYMYI